MVWLPQQRCSPKFLSYKLCRSLARSMVGVFMGQDAFGLPRSIRLMFIESMPLSERRCCSRAGPFFYQGFKWIDSVYGPQKALSVV